MMTYISMFLSALSSATLLPGSSEVLLSSLVVSGSSVITLLWAAATIGNVLGSCVNYWLGMHIMNYQDRRWFPVSQGQIEKAQKTFDRYGVYSLLFAWLPIVGDPLTVVGGIFKVRLATFIVLVTIGKGLRYGLVVALALGIELWV